MNNLVWESIKGVCELNLALGMSHQGVWDMPLPFWVAKEAKSHGTSRTILRSGGSLETQLYDFTTLPRLHQPLLPLMLLK
jgi:hypothetical protein